MANDYCRMVGDGSPWFSCALAGSLVGKKDCGYTLPGEYILDPVTNKITNPHLVYAGLPPSLSCMDPAHYLCPNPTKVSGVSTSSLWGCGGGGGFMGPAAPV